jgi:5'(3')-deoxyribonucleotidase
MTKRLSILVDMDGIVVDLLDRWLAVYNQEFGRSITKADITDWNMHKIVPDGKAIYPIIERQGFFDDLPMIKGAEKGLKRLMAKHDAALVSAASGWALTGKDHWVEKYAPQFLDRMVITRGKTPKSLIKGSLIIDDGPHNMIEFLRDGGYVVGIEYPYNIHMRERVFLAPDYRDTEAAWDAMVEHIEHYAERS